MGSSGGSDGDSTNTIRYAPYIEEQHEYFLQESRDYFDELKTPANSPYYGYTDVALENAFYGSGYTMASFPSLYDMFGKFIAGLDVEVLWTQTLDSTQDDSAIAALTNAHADIVDERITDDVLPRLRAGLRDINAITSSSYFIAVSNIEAKQNHDIAHFDAELRYKLIPIAAERWLNHLKWNRDVIAEYINVMKLAILSKFDQDDHNYKYALADTMWPFTLLEQHRANLGALQGATVGKAGEGPSQTQSAIGGALSGAAMGATVGGTTGAVIGGALGLAASFF